MGKQRKKLLLLALLLGIGLTKCQKEPEIEVEEEPIETINEDDAFSKENLEILGNEYSNMADEIEDILNQEVYSQEDKEKIVAKIEKLKSLERKLIDIEENRRYAIDDLQLVVTNNQDGELDYHFIDYLQDNRTKDFQNRYQATTDTHISLTEPETCFENTQYTYYDGAYLKYNTVPILINPATPAFIPDCEVQNVFIQNPSYLVKFFPEKYKDQSTFTIEELKEVEDSLHEELVPEATFDLKDVQLMKYKDEFFFLNLADYSILYTANSTPTNYDGCKEYKYAYSIAHPEKAFKTERLEDGYYIVDITSIDPNYKEQIGTFDYQLVEPIEDFAYLFEKEENLTREDFLKAEEQLKTIYQEAEEKTETDKELTK